MANFVKRTSLNIGAALMTGLLSSSQAFAGGDTNFSSIAQTMTTSMGSLPALLSGVSYLFGMLLGALGVLKIKDHVENPSQTPLKDGAIRLAAGGALFALPIVYESMLNTIGKGGQGTDLQANLNKVDLGLN